MDALSETGGTTAGTPAGLCCRNWLGWTRVGTEWQRIANPPSPVRIREGPLFFSVVTTEARPGMRAWSVSNCLPWGC
jgi:hypothetical protein